MPLISCYGQVVSVADSHGQGLGFDSPMAILSFFSLNIENKIEKTI